MEPIYLFEAGSTKTALYIRKGNDVQEINLPGFNPNRQNGLFEKELSEIKIPANAKVYFYGSGLSSEINKRIVKELIYNLFKLTPLVYDDLLGAARATLGNRPGIVVIMGTGGIAAWYNGLSIQERKGGYGYLIDDLGGGYELGKRIISHWLNNDFNAVLTDKIAEFLNSNQEVFIEKYYQNIDLLKISELPKLLIEYEDEPTISKLIHDYFYNFFKTHIEGLINKYDETKISLVGGIASNFKDYIHEVARQLNIELEQVIDKPGLKLLKFHSETL